MMPKSLLSILYRIAFTIFILYNDNMNITTNIMNQERLERICQVPRFYIIKITTGGFYTYPGPKYLFLLVVGVLPSLNTASTIHTDNVHH